MHTDRFHLVINASASLEVGISSVLLVITKNTLLCELTYFVFYGVCIQLCTIFVAVCGGRARKDSQIFTSSELFAVPYDVGSVRVVAIGGGGGGVNCHQPEAAEVN